MSEPHEGEAVSEPRNLIWQQYGVDKKKRRTLTGHRSLVVWFTGLSGSGKSTIAGAVEGALHEKGILTYTLDGDNVRHGLNADLGFSDHDRRENIRRVGEVAKLLADAGVLVLCTFISPFRADRDRVRALMEPGEFIEVHVKCDLETCRQRDPKGLYKKAYAGEITDFTGVDGPYEPPEAPELTLDTAKETVEESARRVLEYLKL